MTHQNRKPNRLIHASSPYLLQHAYNPVDWYPWGDEALNRARREDRPIFLSIGYAACHWCHVMERESFENVEIAQYMNDHFVNIKVDREERPDLDSIYMAAVQMITGGGGWPMSVFLTPELKPFYAGTYFPPVDKYGHTGFITVLKNVTAAWNQKPEKLRDNAAELSSLIQQYLNLERQPDTAPDADLFEPALEALRASYDPTHGGFGDAPKVPPVFALELLLRRCATHESGVPGNANLPIGIDERPQGVRRVSEAAIANLPIGNEKNNDLLIMVTHTLDKMAAGGMFDQLGGGFHRYATDANWLVPHFEKMLYDNAQLARVYLEAYQLTGDPAYRRTATATLDYLLRDMLDETGAFHSAEDADSDGQEGMFYLWTQDEILATLGPEDGAAFCTRYGVLRNGNFDSPEHYHRGQNILHLAREQQPLLEAHARLLAARSERVRPGKDDKILVSWNALAIGAFAYASQVLDEDRYRHAAERAARFILDTMMKDGSLMRVYRRGKSDQPAFLDDYAFLAAALIDLYEATFDTRWLVEADLLSRAMIDHFGDPNGASFFLTGGQHTDLIARPRPIIDAAEPSGNAMAAMALWRLGRFLDKPDYQRMVQEVIAENLPVLREMPRGLLKMLCAADLMYGPQTDVVIAGPREHEATQDLLHILHSRFIPGKIVAMYDPSAPDASDAVETIPLLASKETVAGKPAAYVCRNSVCEAPVATPDELLALLGAQHLIGATE